MIPLVSSPTVKRGRGEDGRWTEELQSTPYWMEGATNEVVRIGDDAIESEKEKPVARAVYRAMGEDQPRSGSATQGREGLDPGSPRLRRGLIQNLEHKYKLPKLTDLIPGLNPVLTRALLAELRG